MGASLNIREMPRWMKETALHCRDALDEGSRHVSFEAHVANGYSAVFMCWSSEILIYFFPD